MSFDDNKRRDYQRAWKAAHREHERERKRRSRAKPENRQLASERRRAFHQRNLAAQRAANKKWREENAERLATRQAEYRTQNAEHRRELCREWRRRNPGRMRAAVSKRRAALLQRTPTWSDLKAIERIYVECAQIAAMTGIEHHVDHAYPLQGKTVSGLHVEGNLRIVPAAVNRSKYNSLLEAV